MKLDNPRLEVRYVDDPESLKALIEALGSVAVIGLDAERASGFRYSHRAYLIQIAIQDVAIYLVDPEGYEGDQWAKEL